LFEPVDSKELSNQETATISNTGNTLVEVMDSGESRRIKSTTMMNRRKNSNRNGTSNMKEVKDQKVVNPKEGTNSGNDTDFWWFSLPYVLVCIWDLCPLLTCLFSTACIPTIHVIFCLCFTF